MGWCGSIGSKKGGAGFSEKNRCEAAACCSRSNHSYEKHAAFVARNEGGGFRERAGANETGNEFVAVTGGGGALQEGSVPAERNGVDHYPQAPKTPNANGGKNILRLLLKYGGAGVFRDKGLYLTK